MPTLPPVPTEEPELPVAALPNPEPVKYVYNYELSIQVEGKKVELKKENVSWFYENGEPVEKENAKPGILENMQEKTIYAVVSYDGITIPVKLTDGTEQTVTVTAADQAWSEKIAVGALITLGHGLENSEIQGLKHEREISSNLKEENGGVYAVQAGTVTITDSWKSESGVVYAKKVYEAEAVNQYPAAVFAVVDKATGEPAATKTWYDAAQTVKVTVANDLKLVSAEYLPSVTVGEQTYSNWTEKVGSFVMLLDIQESATICYAKGTEAESSLELKIDSVRPEAKLLYVNTDHHTGALSGKFRVTTGPSGLAEVTINGTAIDLSGVKIVKEEEGKIVYEGKFVNIEGKPNVEIAAVSVAGISSEGDSKEPLSVVFTDVAAENLVSDGFLADGNQYVSFLIENCDPSLTVTVEALDQAQEQITAYELTTTDEGKTYNGKVPMPNGLSALKVVVSDPDAGEDAQRIEYTYDKSYIFDQTAPVVTVERSASPSNVKNGVEYFSESVTYTFTIDDMRYDYNEFQVKYTIKTPEVEMVLVSYYDKEKGNISFTVDNKEQLTSITVIGKDMTGNEVEEVIVVGDHSFTWGEGTTCSCNVVVDTDPPEITAVISDNVKLFYKNNGMDYAVLDQTKDCSTVTLTLFVQDANLDTESLSTNGWTPSADNTYTTTFTANIAENETGVLAYKFNIKDNSGLMCNKIMVTANGQMEDGYNTAVALVRTVGENGVMTDTFEGKILIDRRPPSSVSEGAPMVKLELEKGENEVVPGTAANGLEMFSSAFAYNMHVTDRSVNSQGNEGFDSGLKRVDWDVEYTLWGDCAVENAVTVNENQADTEGDHRISIDAKEDVEATVMLNVTLEDQVGNEFHYVKEFVVDNRAPRIDLQYDNNDVFEVNGQQYYGKVRTGTVTVTDMNPVVENDLIKVNEKAAGERLEDGTYTIAFGEGGEYSVSVDAKDAAGNVAANKADNFIIDMSAPVIEAKLTKIYGAKVELQNSVGDADYYDAPVSVRIAITDYNLDYDVQSSISVAKLVYTTELLGEQTVELSNWVPTVVDGKSIYTHEILVAAGDVLTDVSISARDNANNEALLVDCGEAAAIQFVGEKPAETEVTVFSTERKLVVDTLQPQVTVTKEVAQNSYVQTFNGNAYYNSPVTYRFQVQDNFLDLVENGGSIQIEAVYTDGSEILELKPVEETEEPAEQTKKLSDIDTYNYEFVVEDGRMLQQIKIQVKDNLGRIAAQPVVSISNQEANVESSAVTKTVVDDQGNEKQESVSVLTTAFDKKNNENTWSYTGEPVIVDTTKPVVSVKFSSNVKSFYTNGNTIYVILNTPVVANGSNAAEEQVTVTFETTDKNLTLDGKNFYTMKNGENTPKWVGDVKVNETHSVTLTATSESVKVDNVGGFEIDADVIDLAGNAVADFEIKLGENVHTVKTDAKTGHFDRTISLDRRSPSTSNDNEAPVIEITPSMTPVKTADGKDLFSGSFTYSLKVNDGSNSELNAGLQYVKWTVKDANGVVKTSEKTVSFEDRTLTMSESIPVTINGSGESNDVQIYIEAKDNVGNTITYSSTIGADNLAPRVNVEYSNHSVKNEFYFKANQEITVTIEDLNFDASKSTVDTQVRVPGWTAIGGNKYRMTLSYTSDGDYTFDMASTDLAGNHADIDIPVVLKKFTIDKTAPVIHVSYDPAVPVGTDGAGVQYFDKNRTVTVTITEHNFRASDVRADLGAANALSSWSSRNDKHVASETFTEGNNYRVTVNYEDLAGNAAQSYSSPTFSVDLTAPTITMTTGNLVMGQLNVVPDDLVLGFTINDAQRNLKNFGAEVIFLDRDYKEHKVEGAEFYTISGEGDRSTGYVNFANISRDKNNDGIYTIRLYAEDYAGHVVDLSPALTVSLNRFGSSFRVEDPYTAEFLTPGESGVAYNDEVSNNLVIKEINPTQVWQDAEHSARGSLISVAVNGKTITLEEGVHYSLTVVEKGNSNSKWYEYTYSIYPDVFHKDGELVDGEYAIYFYSEDEAGNRNSNETNVDVEGDYSGKISFVLDHQLPIVTILGIEENERSFDTNRRVEINVSDNTPTILEIYINDELVERVEVSDGMDVSSDWFYYDETTNSYYLNISGKEIMQDLKVVVTDAAGNKFEQEINRLMLTDDVFAQYINSVPAILISIVMLIALIILILLLLKKRKKKEQTPVQA